MYQLQTVEDAGDEGHVAVVRRHEHVPARGQGLQSFDDNFLFRLRALWVRQEVEQDLVCAGVEGRHGLLAVGLALLQGLQNTKIKALVRIGEQSILLCHRNSN